MTKLQRVSQAGLNLIKSFERYQPSSEPLQNGGWVVGYGHTRSARQRVFVSKVEAEYLLRYDLQPIEELVLNEVIVPLSQNEFDALVAFAWNVGKDAFSNSDLLKYINSGHKLAAAECFSAWRKARIGGKLMVVDALVRRRSAEKNLFLNPPNGLSSEPSAFLRPELDVTASVMTLGDGALSSEAKLSNARSRNSEHTAIPDRSEIRLSDNKPRSDDLFGEEMTSENLTRMTLDQAVNENAPAASGNDVYSSVSSCVPNVK